jgi:predicted amidohydrolase
MRDFVIACGQFNAEPGVKSANVAHMIDQAEEAKERGCELVLFPELIVTGYLAPAEVIPLAEPLDGPSVRALARAASRLGMAMAFGLAELDQEQDVRYNSMVVLDKRGAIAAVYHKMHLWASEKEWARGGADLPVFEMDGVACSGWICYDTRFPELARMAALKGAEVGLVSTAWLGPGEEWELALRARALDNSIFVAGADIISPNPALRCRGLSMIVDPKGRVLARAEPGQEGVIYAVLKQDQLDAQRGRLPLLHDRRPKLYQLLLEPGPEGTGSQEAG